MNRGGRQYDDHPDEICTIRHRTAVGESQKAMVCPKAAQIGACTDTPAPVSAESRCTGTVLKREHESWSGGTSSSTAIGVEKAKTIALNDAGLSASQVTFTKAQTDWDDGRMEYDVEFRSGGIEYEYEIDAYSGAILSRDVDRD